MALRVERALGKNQAGSEMDVVIPPQHSHFFDPERIRHSPFKIEMLPGQPSSSKPSKIIESKGSIESEKSFQVTDQFAQKTGQTSSAEEEIEPNLKFDEYIELLKGRSSIVKGGNVVTVKELKALQDKYNSRAPAVSGGRTPREILRT